MSVSRSNSPQARPARAAANRAAARATILAAIAVAFGVPRLAAAQSADTAPATDSKLPAIKVQSKSEALPGDLAPTFGGGQVARGADFGVLGQQKNLDVPFSMTTYTSKLI